jgi:hypothetical protein
MKKNRLIVLIIGMLLVCLFAGNARAAVSPGITAVTGNTYTCYFYTPLDTFSSQVTFDSSGALTMSNFSGNGFYYSAAPLFTGGYWSLGETIGADTGDIIMVLAGVSMDMFIAGTGALLVEYSEVYYVAFAGLQTE